MSTRRGAAPKKSQTSGVMDSGLATPSPCGLWRTPRNDGERLRRSPVHGGARIGAVDRLHGTLDRIPQARDLGGGGRILIVFARALAVFERQRVDRAMGDLPRPHRHVEPGEDLAHL